MARKAAKTIRSLAGMIYKVTGTNVTCKLREKWQKAAMITVSNYFRRRNIKYGEELLQVIKSNIIESNGLKLEERKLI